jgi:hypothetical protein
MSIDEKYKDSFYLGRFFSVAHMLKNNSVYGLSNADAVNMLLSITADYEAGKTPDDIINNVLKATKETL